LQFGVIAAVFLRKAVRFGRMNRRFDRRSAIAGRFILRSIQLLFSLVLAVALLPACGSTTANSLQVDGGRAMRHVEEMVRHGPHPPGSEAQKKVGEYISGQLESFGLEVRHQEFIGDTPIGKLPMVNIWGVLPGQSDTVIILASHYDSKYYEEFEFVGANDSGSSSAVVLELARILARQNPVPYFTLWFVFFDGEEALVEWTDDDSLYGSREFVAMLKNDGKLSNISAMILLDIIGGKDLRLRKDINSTPWLNTIIWNKAAEMGHGNIFLQWGNTSAIDDHIPFAEEGIPVVDIIDLSYAHWHTPEDTIDKLSPRNMEIVGNVVLSSLPEIGRRLQNQPRRRR
jgi:glutaminyl-peptide cyclotransferase